jgi:hypothetical protein
MNITLPLLTLYFVPCIQNQEFQVAISPTMISGKDVGVQLAIVFSWMIFPVDAVESRDWYRCCTTRDEQGECGSAGYTRFRLSCALTAGICGRCLRACMK